MIKRYIFLLPLLLGLHQMNGQEILSKNEALRIVMENNFDVRWDKSHSK
jgi:hypothetical protein